MKLEFRRIALVSLATALGTAALAAAWGSHGVQPTVVTAPRSASEPGATTVNWVVEPFTLEGEVEVLLLRLGMTREALAASGVSSSILQQLLSQAQGAEALSTHTDAGVAGIPELLATHDAQVAEARRTMDALARTVRSGLASDEEVAELAVAKEAYATASAARGEFLESVCMALLELLPEEPSATLMQICQNAKWDGLPVQYRAEARTQGEWLDLRNALASKRTHEQIGEDVPEVTTTVLASFDASEAVATATACCDAELAGVEATWGAIFAD